MVSLALCPAGNPVRGAREERRGFFKSFPLLALLGVSCVSPTAQDTSPFPEEYRQVIYAEWALCQNVLGCLGYEAGGVSPEDFRWRVHSAQFTCGDVEATSGCFSAEHNMIEFYSGHTWVVRHECGHAILYALNQRPIWRCFGHYEQASQLCQDYFHEVAYWPQYCSLEGKRYE
jgi:hypothetical protein